jgi:hypothetical protein
LGKKEKNYLIVDCKRDEALVGSGAQQMAQCA